MDGRRFVENVVNLVANVLIGIYMYRTMHFYMEERLTEIDWDDWHAILYNLAYMLIIAECLLMFSPSNFTNACSWNTLQNLHTILFITAIILATIGLIAVLVSKHHHHLFNVHGILGLISYILLLISALAITAVKLNSNFDNLAANHQYIGIVAFLLGCLSLGAIGFQDSTYEYTTFAFLIGIFCLASYFLSRKEFDL